MKFNRLTLALVLFATSLAHADLVSCYEFTGGSLAVTNELFAGSSGNIALGSSWTPNAVSGQLEQDANLTGTSIAAASNSFSFVYTVSGLTAGQTLNLTDAALDFTGASNTYRFNIALNGANIGANFNPPNSGTYTPMFGGNPTTTGLVNGDTVTIQFRTRDNTAAGTLTADNFKLNGDVISVPEPSSAAFLGLGGLGLFWRRRKNSC